MALKHLLLGLIAVFGPRSGYDIHSTMIKLRRPHLPQIYLSLKEMAKDSLVESERIHSADRPTKNVFRITDRGYEELQRWLEDKDDIEPIYEPLTQKLWFSRMAHKEAVIENLKSYIKHRTDELAYYEKLRKKYTDTAVYKHVSTNPLDKFFSGQALDYIIERGYTDIKWSQKAIASISSISDEEWEAGMVNTGTVNTGKKTRKKKSK